MTPDNMQARVQAIRERVETVTGFEAIEHPNAGLTGRRELAELDKDGETWRLWDKNSPFSWKALTFIVHAPGDIRTLLDYTAALSRKLEAAEAALSDVQELCEQMMAMPEARRGSYVYVEFRPYEEILGLLNEHASAPQPTPTDADDAGG